MGNIATRTWDYIALHPGIFCPSSKSCVSTCSLCQESSPERWGTCDDLWLWVKKENPTGTTDFENFFTFYILGPLTLQRVPWNLAVSGPKLGLSKSKGKKHRIQSLWLSTRSCPRVGLPQGGGTALPKDLAKPRGGLSSEGFLWCFFSGLPNERSDQVVWYC